MLLKISIAQLLKELFCVVTFTRGLCVIQYHTTRSSIGVGKQRRGVYLYKTTSLEKIHANHTIHLNLWRQRLEHPSHQAISHLSRSFGEIVSSNKGDVCDVCYRVKRTCLPFLISETKHWIFLI